MQPNKVYESLAHLANNIVKNEKLRFELFDKPLFKDQFVKQINNMLALEKDFDQELNGEKWATIFAKAIVKIIGQKQRFEKPEGRSIEEIYADYSAFLSYTTTSFMVGRNELIDDSIKFTEQDVLYSAVLSEDAKVRYKNLENEKIQAEQKTEEQQKQPNQQNNQNSNAGFGQQNNNYFGGGYGGVQQPYGNMPVHPMQDPRFYPYNAKPKWMPIMRWVLATVVCIAAIMLIVMSAVMMSIKLDFTANEYGEAFFNPKWNGTWDDFWDTKIVGDNFEAQFSLMAANLQTILGFFFYIIPAVYISYYAFRKPRTLTEKYRLNIWPVIFMIIFFVFAIISVFNFMSPGQIKVVFRNSLLHYLKPAKDVGLESYHFNEFWDVVMLNYGQEIKQLTAVVDVAVAFVSVSIILGIVLWIVNPRLDREKVAFALGEFQKATMAAMQGESYQMNPSLFESEDEMINQKQSKFSVWWQKTFKTKKSKKDKKDKEN